MQGDQEAFGKVTVASTGVAEETERSARALGVGLMVSGDGVRRRR